jgi:hypothetical protein
MLGVQWTQSLPFQWNLISNHVACCSYHNQCGSIPIYNYTDQSWDALLSFFNQVAPGLKQNFKMLLIKKNNPDVLLFINKLNDHSWMAQSGHPPQEDLARFGYTTNRVLECFEIMLYFVTCKNLLSNFFLFEYEIFKKHWHIFRKFCEGKWNIFWNIWEQFICQNENFTMKLFFGTDLVNLKGFFVFLHKYPTI